MVYVVITSSEQFFLVSRKQVDSKNKWVAEGFEPASMIDPYSNILVIIPVRYRLS